MSRRPAAGPIKRSIEFLSAACSIEKTSALPPCRNTADLFRRSDSRPIHPLFLITRLSSNDRFGSAGSRLIDRLFFCNQRFLVSVYSEDLKEGVEKEPFDCRTRIAEEEGITAC